MSMPWPTIMAGIVEGEGVGGKGSGGGSRGHGFEGSRGDLTKVGGRGKNRGYEFTIGPVEV